MKRTTLRSMAAVAAVFAMTIGGLMGAAPSAHAANLVPVSGHEPSIQVLDSDGTVKIDPATKKAQLMPQVGTVLMVDVGQWPDQANVKFTYQWATVDSTNVATDITGTVGGSGNRAVNPGTNRNAIPLARYVGQSMRVTITATDGADSGTFVITTPPVVGVNPAVKSVPDSNASYISVFGNPANPNSPNYVPPSTAYAFLTAFGWPDNTPALSDYITAPSTHGATTFPNQGAKEGIHLVASGDGSYADPITVATGGDSADVTWSENFTLWDGQEFYVPRIQKYFIVEDYCGACTRDITGRGPLIDNGNLGTLLGPGSDGGPGLLHFDMWVGGQDGDFADALACEDALTWYNADNSPYMDEIIVNPGPNEPVSPHPLFDEKTGVCNEKIDGSSLSLSSADNVGPYQNIPAPAGTPGVTGTYAYPAGQPGMCITDPGNSAAVGTRITMEPCDPTNADQNLTFSGQYLIFNNLCLDSGDGFGNQATPITINGVAARPVTLQRCNYNMRQEWTQYSDYSISGGGGALADLGVDGSGNHYLWSVTSGNYAYQYWDNPYTRGADNTSAVKVKASSIDAGGTVHIDVSGLTTLTANVILIPSPSKSSAGKLIGTIDLSKAGPYNGTFSGDFKVPSGTKPGTYVIEVVGLSGYGVPIPSDPVTGSTAITSVDQLVPDNGTMDNFKTKDRTSPVVGTSAKLTVKAAGTLIDTGGQVTSSTVPIWIVTGLLGLGLAAMFIRRRGLFVTTK